MGDAPAAAVAAAPSGLTDLDARGLAADGRWLIAMPIPDSRTRPPATGGR